MIKNIKDIPDKLIDLIDLTEYEEGEYKLNIVMPGDLITTEKGFMHGHGTFEENGNVYSNIVGTVEKTNKLIIVNPVKTKYLGDVGDIVIGRVIEITNKRWHIDIDSYNAAFLNLNSINLPSGVQRRKTEEDELNMRQFFAENDIIVAEVHSLNNDKSLQLHTRSAKYGKLSNGQCIKVQHKLIKRQKNHFIDLKNGVSLIIGHNGNIWISWNKIENDTRQKDEKSHRENVTKIRNCIKMLDEESIDINIDNINELFEIVSKRNISSKDILLQSNKKIMREAFRQKLENKIPNEMNKLIKQGNIINTDMNIE